MKIARFTEGDRTRLGVVLADTGEVADVGSMDASLPTDLGDLLAAGSIADVVRHAANAPRLALDSVRLEAPIARPPTILAIGLNYAAHVSESGLPKPDAPIVFNKQITCVIGPDAGIEVPTVAPDWVDYEGELAMVIGTACRNVAAPDAASVVAGYTIINDVSVHDWQRATPTMTMGKSWDSHGPMGPWLVTADEIGDPHTLRLRTWVDGEFPTGRQHLDDDHQLLGTDRPPLDHVHPATRDGHRHGNAGRGRLRHGSAALPETGLHLPDRDRTNRGLAEPGRRPTGLTGETGEPAQPTVSRRSRRPAARA